MKTWMSCQTNASSTVTSPYRQDDTTAPTHESPPPWLETIERKEPSAWSAGRTSRPAAGTRQAWADEGGGACRSRGTTVEGITVGKWTCKNYTGQRPEDQASSRCRGKSSRNHLTATFALASSSSFLSFSASALEMPSLTFAGALSTRSLASLRPRPVAARTTLMIPIFASAG